MTQEAEGQVPRGISLVEAMDMGAEGQAVLLEEMIVARLEELDAEAGDGNGCPPGREGFRGALEVLRGGLMEVLREE